MGRQCRYLLSLLILVLASSKSHSWSWFPSSEETQSSTDHESPSMSGTSVGKFSMEGHNDDPKAIRLVEDAEKKLVGPNSCWQNAYRHLFSGCSEVHAVEEKRSRFAWHLSDCFQKDSARPPFPACDPKSAMYKCLKTLNNDQHKVYLEFYLETNSICHQLQARAFKYETERLVNELKNSAQYAEDKLEIIEEKAEQLLQGSSEIFDSLNSIDLRTQQVAQTAENVEDHIDVVLKHSTEVYEQSRKIQESQSELQEGQVEMKKNLKEGMAMLQDSYIHLGQEIDNLKTEAVEIEKEIIKVGDQMYSRMENLQVKADDIGNMAGLSLDKQKQLLDGQTTALKELDFLTKFQSEALEESRRTLQRLTEYGQRQQEELLQKQIQLQKVHDHLMENSKSMLEAQESFESKQASMFAALDKLLALHNAMLLESRVIKAFFIYSISIFVIYMFTSTKRTYTVRPRLYIGLCLTLLVEVAILRLTGNDIEQQTWKINLLRTLFAATALVQLMHAIFTYRDYEVLNHQLLHTLIEKVNGMQRYQKFTWDRDSDLNWSSWLDSNLPEDEDCSDDPDYLVPEQVGDNLITASSIKEYDLRQRLHF
ncbi:PREDICTED: protein GAMETE EXPRESSED 1 [Fragaria vesca subsp. vesca]|uniref:protein GAMETE EXPRESSED 1 n=1 Tax=Fragaria vesca subsp. vesca TaxID=101020 RepID=UPI0002C2E99C|nr:PREDICTED: protein GAMETE EXPRESSED 1 [Fragaria vesca subsp. vesca]XP_011463327.1 PREDICTED: protein GAMETE EXPRESSED 1 [Fragaria vesca subsp. vesca]